MLTGSDDRPIGHKSVRAKLDGRSALFGLMQAYPGPMVTELASIAGYDFIVLDAEHGLFDDAAILHALHIAQPLGLSVFVRPRTHDLQAIGRIMDMRVDGLLVPNIASADQAQAIVAATRYPPAGTRGYARSGHRVTRYGFDLKHDTKPPRDDALLLMLVESPAGIADLPAILATPGVDGAMIGPADLTATLGDAGNFATREFHDAVAALEAAGAAHGKVIGMPPVPGQPAAELARRGHRLFIIGSDTGLVREGMSNQLAAARASMAADG